MAHVISTTLKTSPSVFCILMLYNHDIVGLQSTRFSGLHNTSNRARMALWDVQHIYFRLTRPSFVFFFIRA